MVEKAVGNIDDASRVKAVAVFNNHSVYGNDKYFCCMLLRAGGINVEAADIQGNGEYNPETLAKWDPDVIITQDRYPDADSIALGELWMAHMFYPDLISSDVVLERAKKFYQEFYGVPFKSSVYDEADAA